MGENNKKLVLIVEDNDTIREMLSSFISCCFPDFKVRTAASGKEAIEKIEKNALDLLITDFQLKSHENGLDVILMAFEIRGRALPVIAMSGDKWDFFQEAQKRVSEDILVELKQRFLEKPLRLQSLGEMINKVVI